MLSSSAKSFDKTKTEISFRELLEFAPIGILVFQRDWKIKFVNKNFFLFPGVLGEKPENILSRSVYDYRLVANVDLRPELETLKKGEMFEKEITSSKTLRGGQVSLLIKGTPIILEEEFAGGILILEDVKFKSPKSSSLAQSVEFHNFLSRVCDFFLITDTAGNVEGLNATADAFDFVFESENIQSSNKSKKISPKLFKNVLETVVNSNKPASVQIPFLKENKESFVKVNLIPLSSDALKVDKVIFLFEDLTKQPDNAPLADEEIKELLKYEQIAASILDGLIGINKHGRITLWNESASKLFGLTKSEVFGKFIGKIFPTIDEQKFAKLREEVKEKKSWEEELYIGADESIAEFFKIKVRSFGEGDDESLIFSCSDITERVRTEKELKNSEERFRSIVKNLPDFICTLDPNGQITYANPRFLEAFQYSEKEILKINFNKLIDPFSSLSSNFNFNELSAKKSYAAELSLLTKQGQKIHVMASFSAIADIKGEVEYYNVIITDITLKKESEKDMLLIRSVFEASLDGIALINKKKFVLVNDSFVKMFGYKSASELLGKNPIDFVEEKDKWRISGFIELAEEGKDSPARYEFTGRRKDNTSFEAENSVSNYEIEKENFVVWVLRDVTEEKRSKKILQASEERYREITENINECIWTAEDRNGELKTVFYTPAIKKITSYDAQTFRDDPDLWGKIIHPDDAIYVSNALGKLYGDPVRNIDTLEYRIIDALGNVIWLENKITIIRNSKGKIQKVFGIISDISAAKYAEEELKRSAKNLEELNETKDRFISIISHDLRTPFSSIIGFTDLLLNEKDLTDEKQTQYMNFIKESSNSMLSLVNSLLDWTRLQTGRIKFEPDRINAKLVIEKAIQILSGAALQKNINLVSEIEKDFYIHADEELLLQAFNNLISNAIKFTNSGGYVRISARPHVEKKQIEFIVKDDGIGMRKDDIEKLFKIDSKFTTSGTAGEKGSGLGLSLVHDIIRKHGGDISAQSQLGKGTEFIFSIPVASANILLVDDVKTDRMLYSKLLKNLIPNYNILEAEDGKQALVLIKQTLPALVITDHKMPVMSGYDLVKQLNIAELKFKPPVIVLSSDINKMIEAEYKELGVEFVFQKPVNLSAFKNAIERSMRKALFN